MDTGLADSTVLITGASGGIGRSIARAFADEGAFCGLHFHQHAERVAGIAEHGLPLQADLRREDDTRRMFRVLVEARRRIDAVVVNAGIWVAEPVPLERMSLAQWNETLGSDLTSAFLTCRAFLGHLADQPRDAASIVLVGSTAALFGEQGHADYASAKAGLVYGLTLSLKNEIVRLAARGRVNCVCPGWVATPMVSGSLVDSAVVERATATMPLRKIASPEDVARAVVFLTSDRLAGHVSGAILPVAGGMEGRRLR